MSAKLPESFPHSLYAYARPARSGQTKLYPSGYALAAIADFESDRFWTLGNTNRGGRTARMTMNVGQTLLYHTKYRGLEFWREPPQILRNFQSHRNLAPLGKSLDKPTNGRRKTSLVKQRRMQQVRDGAQLLRQLLNQMQAFGAGTSCAMVKIRTIALNGSQIHVQRHQHLAGTVVQFTGNATAFFVLQLQEPS